MKHPPELQPERPLRLRRRMDLEVAVRQVRGRNHFVLKDPVALRYHQLSDHEHFLWKQIDGQTSAEEICQRFEDHFLTVRITPLELQSLVEQFHRNGLVLADATNQGDVLLRRSHRLQREFWLGTLSNPLAIRLPGFDPRKWLTWLQPIARVVFSTPAVVLGSSVVIVTLLLATIHFREFQFRLTETQHALTTHWEVALLALATLKVLHELSHAALCRRFRRECHELGVMLLVFTPCLYCNVTDSWMLTSKWKRAAIAAVGIWVELVLSAVFGLLWWFSEPGVFQVFCFDVMLIGSLNSLLLNGNPLLRFDGYFVLSDLAEFPNLAQRSQRVLEDGVRQALFGVRWPSNESHSDRRWLGIYGITSQIYRILLVTAIVTGCYVLLQPYRLQSLALFLAMPMIVGPLKRSITGIQRAMKDPQIRRSAAKRRFAVAMVAVAVLAALILVPLPRTITADAVLRFNDERTVRVLVEGRLIESVREGEMVHQGTAIARLENDALLRQLSELQEREIQLAGQIEELQALRDADPDAAAKIPSLQEQLRGAHAERQSREQDVARLELTAPRTGLVVGPMELRDDTEEGQLATWSGTPLQPENAGCLLEEDTILCVMGDPQDLTVIADVASSAIDAVNLDQPVRIRLTTFERVLTGRVQRISEMGADRRPESPDASQAPTGQSPKRYSIVIALDEPDVKAPLGSPGRARISVAPMSLAKRIQQWAGRTFRLRM